VKTKVSLWHSIKGVAIFTTGEWASEALQPKALKQLEFSLHSTTNIRN